jgi:3-methyladenine DNA glycosylase AlkD
MWIYRIDYGKRYRKFFRLTFRYDTLSNYYQTNFALMQHHKYSLTELENMIPWERTIYIALLVEYLKQEKERIELQKQTRQR